MRLKRGLRPFLILAILFVLCLPILVALLVTGGDPGLLFEAWKFEPDAILLMTQMDIVREEVTGFRSISQVEPRKVRASPAESLSLPPLEPGCAYYLGQEDSEFQALLIKTPDYEIRVESAVQDANLTLIRLQIRNTSAASLVLQVNQSTLDLYARSSMFSRRVTTTRLLPLVVGYSVDSSHFKLMINPETIHGSHADPSLEVGRIHDLLGKWGDLFQGDSPECKLADQYVDVSLAARQTTEALVVYETTPAQSCTFNCYLKLGDRPLIAYRLCFDVVKFDMATHAKIIRGGVVGRGK